MIKLGKVIVVEGLSYAGKTTFCKKLSKIFSAVYIPPIENVKINKKISDKNKREFVESKKFLFENFKLSRKAEKLKKNGKIVIMDRNYSSTLAFTYANFILSNSPNFWILFLEYLRTKQKKRIFQPDLYIFLDTDLRTVLKRQKENKIFHPFWSNYKFIKNVRNFYKIFFGLIEKTDILSYNKMPNIRKVYRDVKTILKL